MQKSRKNRKCRKRKKNGASSTSSKMNIRHVIQSASQNAIVTLNVILSGILELIP